MPTSAPAIKTTEKAKCSNCGKVCQLQVERWTNSLEVQQLRLPNTCCNACGHPWNKLPGQYSKLLRDAYWAPQNYWSTAGRAENLDLVRGISPKRQAELTGYIEDLHAALIRRYARALDTSSSSALQVISSVAPEEKFRTLDEHLRLWTAKLLAMQRSLISELEQVWHAYSIPAPDRDWVPKATDLIWKPIANASLRWVIEALGVSADATIWLAPNWLYAGELQAARIRSIDEWDATQNVICTLCERVHRKLGLQREEILNDARRKLRLKSNFPIESQQHHHGAGSMPEKLTKKTDLSRVFDRVNLTDRQRECASLRFEFGLTVSAIATKFGLTRKTVDEHLQAAEVKLQLYRAKQIRDKNGAKRTRE
jgi:DNA-binding CsgD family transcriptional regulator